MKKIYLITDYFGRFGTKYTAVPYRSGMDKELLKRYFGEFEYEAVFVNASEFNSCLPGPAGSVVLYTSAEDKGGYYKSYLEDLIYSAEIRGAITLPAYRYLKAHNNKVFAELLRSGWSEKTGDKLVSHTFGSLEELRDYSGTITFPAVIKRPEGFKSRGVYLANDRKELEKIAAMISGSRIGLKELLTDRLRKIKHPGYRPESLHRKKFIVQEFVTGLENDFKILVYGNKFYVLKRLNRKNDFRASGSGLLSYPDTLPDGLLDFAKKAFEYFRVPNASFDISFNGRSFSILEVQFLYFGTYTVEHSEFWFEHKEHGWQIQKGRSVLEKEYVNSIHFHLRNNI